MSPLHEYVHCCYIGIYFCINFKSLAVFHDHYPESWVQNAAINCNKGFYDFALWILKWQMHFKSAWYDFSKNCFNVRCSLGKWLWKVCVRIALSITVVMKERLWWKNGCGERTIKVIVTPKSSLIHYCFKSWSMGYNTVKH